MKYKKKEYNLLIIFLNLIKEGFLYFKKSNKKCNYKLHWSQRLDYKTNCSICGKSLY